MLPEPKKEDLTQAEVAYNQLMQPIRGLLSDVCRLLDAPQDQPYILRSLLRSMRDTHESIIAVIIRAKKWEKDAGKLTGRAADAVPLARVQFDGVFIGLLILHDPSTYCPLYHKAGWAALVKEIEFIGRHIGETVAGKPWLNEQRSRYSEMASNLAIPQEEQIVTLAEAKGEPPPEAFKHARIRPFPTPGHVVSGSLLRDGPFKVLGELLWQQWKFLCDPAHMGILLLALKNALRGDPVHTITKVSREDMIHFEVENDSVIPSILAMLCLLTAIVKAAPHGDTTDLRLRLIDAWKPLAEGVAFGSILWSGWTKKALGIPG